MRANQRSRLESFVLNESRTAVLFYLAGVAAGLALLPDKNLSGRDHVAVIVLISVLVLGSIVRVVWRDRLTAVASQLMFTFGWIVVTAATAIGPNVHVDFAVVYLWVAVYASLYFRPTLIFLQMGPALTAYLIVLLNSGLSIRDAVVSWLTIFVTSSLLAAVTYALVSSLRRSSHEDPLTGLANRRSWDELIDTEFERAKRAGTPISVISIDVDNFKDFNDSEGHAGGDRVLRDVAERWREVLRGGGDVIARLGGDEFGVLAPGSGVEDIDKVMDRLAQKLPVNVDCSMGAATWDRVESSADLFRRADEEMFRAKRERKMMKRDANDPSVDGRASRTGDAESPRP